MSTLTLLADIGGRGAVVGFLLPVTIVALVAYGVFELVRSREASPAPVAVTDGSPAPASSSALSILDERFARGEIDAEEFVRRRSLLAPPAATTWNPAPPSPAADPAPVSDPAPTGTEPTVLVDGPTAVEDGTAGIPISDLRPLRPGCGRPRVGSA